MKWNRVLLCVVLSIVPVFCNAQAEPKVLNATPILLDLFRSHDIVMLGEMHRNKQEYDWLRSLVADPKFAEVVDDIVMKFGNSRYQAVVDRVLAVAMLIKTV